MCELNNNNDAKGIKMEFTSYDLLNCVKNAITKYHGDYGMGSVMTSLAG